MEAIVAGAVQPSSTPAEMHVQKGNQDGPADVQLNVSYVWGQKTASRVFFCAVFRQVQTSISPGF